MVNKTNQKNILNGLTNCNKLAFRNFFRLYYPRLEKYATYFLKNHEEAEDLVQEVFLQIWQNRKAIKRETHFESYLFTLVRNRCLNTLKRKVVEDKFVTSQASEVTEELYHISFNAEGPFLTMQEMLHAELEKIIAEMPERCRVAFRLKWMEGKKIREIAEAMKISTTMVDKHLAKGLQIARHKLSPDLFFCCLPITHFTR